MSLTKFEKDVENIIKLPDVVKDQPQTLKQTFDKAGVDIKEYINDTLTEELDNTISALDGDVVKLDGDQTIDDTKTYLKNIVADTPPTLDGHLTNKLYVDTLDQARKAYIDTNFATKAENALKANLAEVYTRTQLNNGQLNNLYFAKSEADIVLLNLQQVVAGVGQGFDEVINYLQNGQLPPVATDLVFAQDGTTVTATSGIVYI